MTMSQFFSILSMIFGSIAIINAILIIFSVGYFINKNKINPFAIIGLIFTITAILTKIAELFCELLY